jgi:pSer/pThr/pTyr-binding forkhead associated (FHA) protein
MASIKFTLQDGTVVTHELTEEQVTLGRVPGNTVELPDASVSSRHAQLTRAGEDYVFRDLGSTNGSQVNGSAATPEEDYPLSNGDTVTLGSVLGVYGEEQASETKTDLQTTEASPISAQAAASSSKPSNFSNASPFQARKTRKDPLGIAMIVLSVLSMLAAGFALVQVFAMQAPL